MTRDGLFAAFRMAIDALWQNRARTALTSLGILIGVGSVIAMIGLGRGATAAIQQDLASFGNNMLDVQAGVGGGPQARSPAPPLGLGDVDAIAGLPDVAAVAPIVASAATAVVDDATWDTTVQGTTSAWLTITARDVVEGRAFTEAEDRSGASVCVIGTTVRDELFGQRDYLGRTMRIGSATCAVIGLLAPSGTNAMGMDQDDLVLLPVLTVQRRLVGSTDVSSIRVSTARADQLDGVTAALDALLRERRHVASDTAMNFEIRDTREMAERMSSITGMLTAFLSAVAGVSLLVGGIGIMNIMLVSVTERTREIGIRMAVGALETDIRMQFVVEAVVLSVFGGVVGVGVGVGLTAVGAWGFGIPFVVEPWAVVGSVFFSALMGVGFGWLPARRAAALEPIDALRA